MTRLQHRRPLLTTFAIAASAALTLAACGADPAPGPPSPAPAITAEAPTATPSPFPPDVIGGNPTVEVVSQDDVVTGLDAPWDMAFLPDGAILVTERDSGNIHRVRSGQATALNGPGLDAIQQPLDPTGEAGLLGIVVHPDDPSLLYIYLTRDDGNAVLRMSLQGDMLTDATPILTGIPKARNHDGGRMAFGPDGYLYIATGDAAVPDLSQDVDSLAGKILRVVADGGESDGAPAEGNPFDNEVWALGLRNVQGLGWVDDGRMYASEFGASAIDELNLIEPGANYGWPIVEGLQGAPDGTELGQTVDGLTYPVVEWTPAEASPSGIAVTNEGIYVATLRGERVWRVQVTPDGIGEQQVLLDGLGRIRHVEVGPDGALYVITNNTDGRGSPRDNDDRILRVVVQ